MEAWKPAGAGHSSEELDAHAMADLVLRSRSIPHHMSDRQSFRREIEHEVAERTAHLEEASRSKDQFLAMLTHELRTPLMPAMVALDSLQSRTDLPDDVADALKLISRNVRHEARLVDDLLDLTRVARGKLSLERQPTDAHAPLRQAIEVCRAAIEAKRLHLELSLNAPTAAVIADSSRLQQVFWNLLENAVKFTPQGGTIACRSSQSGNDLVIEISDNGIGIEADTLPRIFEAFEQGGDSHNARLGGLGLGLAIARGIVQAHGGTLTAKSDGKNRGSTFTLQLPTNAVSETIDDTKKPQAPPRSSNGSLRLLLVEDHLDTLRVLEQLLRQNGYIVATALDLKSAKGELDRQPFDLLISDIGLPDGTGHELMQHALQQHQKLKGIALTGSVTDEDLKSSQASGFTAHIKKPIDFAKLTETIDAVAAGNDSPCSIGA